MSAQYREVPLDRVVGYMGGKGQSRKPGSLGFNNERITRLAEGLVRQGQVVEIIVRQLTPAETRQHHGDYELIAGERRVVAARQAGLPNLRARILPAETPRKELALTNLAENAGREKICDAEIAECIVDIIDQYGVTADEVANASQMSPRYIARILPLARLCPEVLLLARRCQGDLPTTQLLKLVGLQPATQLFAAQEYLAARRQVRDGRRGGKGTPNRPREMSQRGSGSRAGRDIRDYVLNAPARTVDADDQIVLAQERRIDDLRAATRLLRDFMEHWPLLRDPANHDTLRRYVAPSDVAELAQSLERLANEAADVAKAIRSLSGGLRAVQ